MADTLTNIQFRIKSADKKKFTKVLEDIGLDAPSAFRMFVKKVIDAKGIPFRAQKLTVNGMTEAEEQEILQMIEETKTHPEKFSGPFSTAQEAIAYLRSL